MKSFLGQNFRKLFSTLPNHVKILAKKNFKLWINNPKHPSLNFKLINKEKNIYSVRIGKGWRALGIREKDEIVWIWIGSHEDYNKLV
ncbi:MAG: hypothetical protein J0M18_08940 [Ignavibacteria bacterium]|jgi:hypothetical protein|nr:hypothetical protein [Ignavibacteria bacterium]